MSLTHGRKSFVLIHLSCQNCNRWALGGGDHAWFWDKKIARQICWFCLNTLYFRSIIGTNTYERYLSGTLLPKWKSTSQKLILKPDTNSWTRGFATQISWPCIWFGCWKMHPWSSKLQASCKYTFLVHLTIDHSRRDPSLGEALKSHEEKVNHIY